MQNTIEQRIVEEAKGKSIRKHVRYLRENEYILMSTKNQNRSEKLWSIAYQIGNKGSAKVTFQRWTGKTKAKRTWKRMPYISIEPTTSTNDVEVRNDVREDNQLLSSSNTRETMYTPRAWLITSSKEWLGLW